MLGTGSSAPRVLVLNLLADRIEEAAADLAAFAEGLSEAEWRAPVSGNGTEGRSVGVIVHHVASVYPIEINLARAIADGADISDVTWEVFAELNANHGQDQGGVTKTAALELLRRNSRNAAAAVRAFTDEELDRAAPSLIGISRDSDHDRSAGHSSRRIKEQCGL
jgi:hypothetical protein